MIHLLVMLSRLLGLSRVRWTSACLLVGVLDAYSSDQIPARPQDHPIAIVGATIHTVSGPTIEKGTILFEKGRIVAVGIGVNMVPNTEHIDGSGKHVYPGLISSNTEIGLVEIGAVRASRDMAEIGRINPNVRAQVAVNPESELIPVLRANGITLAVSAPSGGLISGTSALMMMDGWTWEDMTLRAPLALYVNWPSMRDNLPSPATTNEEEQKKEQGSALKELMTAFHDARAYMTAKKAETEKGVPYHNTDLRWESMIPVLEAKIPVVVWADEIRQIQAAVAWAEQENIRIIIGGGYDAWRVADLLKKKDIPVLAGGIHRLPARRSEEYDDPYTLPARLHQAGIRFAIITAGSAAHERNLPFQAGTAAAYGLPKDIALRAVTLSPAEIFGVADRVGSLEAGKDATLILTTGDPLEITTTILTEYIQGRKVDLTSKHTILYEKYKEKYRRVKP
jgi:imidazolonepropionase-like amidohydrolase